MDIKAQLEKLSRTRADLQATLLKQKEEITKLDSTIKKLTKLSGQAEALIEDSPVIESDVDLILKVLNVSKNLV